MTDYAVINPATGERVKSYDTISDADLKAAIDAADKAHREWSRSTTVAERAALVRRIGELHVEHRQRLGEIIVREMGKPIEQALGEIDFCGAIYEYYADNADSLLADEEIKLSEGDGLGAHPPQLDRRGARDHAVELPLLPGRALRRPEPRDRQHGAAQARPAVPRVGRRDRGALPRGGRPRGRVHQHLRQQRADRRRDRRPARPGRLRHGLGARRRGRGRDRRSQPEEGRARAGRLRSVHPAQHRRPRQRRRVGRRRAPRERRAGLQRGQALRRRRGAVPAVRRQADRRDHGGRAGRPHLVRHRRWARSRPPPRPTGWRTS